MRFNYTSDALRTHTHTHTHRAYVHAAQEQLAAEEIFESQHILKTLKLHVAPLSQKVEIAR
jgi:hypothetical protein